MTSFIRDPFVEGEAYGGDEEPVPTGDFHQALGELVTCSRCVGTWVAAGLATTQLVALGAAGINDFLQAGVAALAHRRAD